MLFKFPAAVTATKVFQVQGKGEVTFRALSSNWGTATLTLTVDNGVGTYFSFPPSTDPTTPLVGAPFIISANLATVLTLGAGHYGITITNTPTSPIYLEMTHKALKSDDNTGTYTTTT
jgi:hypothetical protein